MENSLTNLEPALPPELEREIFEFAALWYPTTITSLLRVCHRVHCWINPFLYTVLPLDGSGRIGHVEETLRAKPFLRRPIGHVLVDLHSFDDTDWIALFRLTSTTPAPPEFVLKGLDMTSPGLKGVFTTLPLMQPQRLTFEFLRQTAPSGIFDTLSLHFSTLTHLTLLHADPYEWVFWRYWEHLTTLPVLTHLCLTANVSRVILPHVLKDCATLQAVLTTWLVPAPARASKPSLSSSPPRIRAWS
ncbi:hypothetical protein C8R46DRAFT_1124127 [Mycena filopes]|nr:hypothetical protein C8R46DRAFT_1124127 [Mycena filopes]